MPLGTEERPTVSADFEFGWERVAPPRFLAEPPASPAATPGEPKEDEEEDDAARCGLCGEEIYDGDYVTPDHVYLPGVGWASEIDICFDCGDTCADCDRASVSDDLYLIDGRHVCEGCSCECQDCGERYLLGDISWHSAHESYFCGDCWPAERQGRQLSHYHHTRAMAWLGGPLPTDERGKMDGYYIGFENEISADESEEIDPIYDWAEEHLGSDAYIDCKEDSSVHGFEIVTQPMTPEFFERTDWDSFFEVLNDNHPVDEEPSAHGLHVHISKIAFRGSGSALAAFSYLLGNNQSQLERIGRRKATHYCEPIRRPVSEAILAHSADTRGDYASGKQAHRIYYSKQRGLSRGAVNLSNSKTVEIRAFKSARSAKELKDAVRLTYVAAEYIRHLQVTVQSFPSRLLTWTEFARWVAVNHPAAFASIAGTD